MNAFREISDDLRKTIVKGLQHKIIVNPNPPSETPSSISSRYTFFRNFQGFYQIDNHEIGICASLRKKRISIRDE